MDGTNNTQPDRELILKKKINNLKNLDWKIQQIIIYIFYYNYSFSLTELIPTGLTDGANIRVRKRKYSPSSSAGRVTQNYSREITSSSFDGAKTRSAH